ncbi:MAG: hypothetical protein WA184_01220, partial [Stellaceae bacterium]
MSGKRDFAGFGAIGMLIAALGCASLPGAALGQTTPNLNDQLKQLQSEIKKIQKQYQNQLRSLQKQVDEL